MSDEQNLPQLEMAWPRKRPFLPPHAPLATGYIIRTFEAEDAPQFFELMALAGWPGWDDEKLRPWLHRLVPQGWFLAVEQQTGQLAASAMALHDHTWHTHRNQGLATAVVTAVIDRFLAIGYPTIHLFTEHYRLPALHIYLKMGFEPLRSSPETTALWARVLEELGYT